MYEIDRSACWLIVQLSSVVFDFSVCGLCAYYKLSSHPVIFWK